MSDYNDRFIRALLKQPVDRTPVWLMRQAGRYLPEYRELRAKTKNFLEFCKTPELASEVTLQPLRRFNLDAAIIFSDILTIPDAMGADLKFAAGEGPVFNDPIRDQKAVDALNAEAAVEKLSYVADAIKLVKPELSVPLIGFAGSPWTVSTYLVEGKGSKTFEVIRRMMFQDPSLLKNLLEKLTQVTIDYLNMQIDAGADVIMLFDSWGGILSPVTYPEFSLSYMSKIAKGLKLERDGQKIPLIFFTKGGGLWLEQTANAGCDAVGLDWTINIADAKRRVGDKVALQGNLDPMTLFAEPEIIQRDVKKIITDFDGDTGHVLNLGHGINKDTPIEAVEAMIAAVDLR